MIDYTQFAFIFDMDGTLVDNMRVHTEAWSKRITIFRTLCQAS
jgi:beta-phosphoglucomutase-like phosphatase (HAD superfamily)